MAEEAVNPWGKTADYDYAVAGVLLTTPEGWILGHHRDGNTPFSTNLVCVFGGRLETTDKTALEGAVRELEEETNIRGATVEPFMSYLFKINGFTEQFNVFISYNHTTDGLEIYEGQGYHIVKTPDDPLIAPIIRPVVDKWFSQKS